MASAPPPEAWLLLSEILCNYRTELGRQTDNSQMEPADERREMI